MDGFTLLELLIVMAIIAALGTLALPNFRQQLQRTHRSEAKAALLHLHTNQERWYLEHNSYTDDLSALGFASGRTENGVYVLEVASADGLLHGYVATARAAPGGGSNGVSMQDDSDCQTFSIDSAGRRSASPDSERRCW